MLITKSHTLNCYLLLLKFLLNTKSLLVTVVAQFTAKTTNSEKAIYFLSLTSCSVNRPKSQILITCKDFILSDFTWKKTFCIRKWCVGWRPSPPPHPALPFPYGPAPYGPAQENLSLQLPLLNAGGLLQLHFLLLDFLKPYQYQ